MFTWKQLNSTITLDLSHATIYARHTASDILCLKHLRGSVIKQWRRSLRHCYKGKQILYSAYGENQSRHTSQLLVTSVLFVCPSCDWLRARFRVPPNLIFYSLAAMGPLTLSLQITGLFIRFGFHGYVCILPERGGHSPSSNADVKNCGAIPPLPVYKTEI
jgi:hypothetical protein